MRVFNSNFFTIPTYKYQLPGPDNKSPIPDVTAKGNLLLDVTSFLTSLREY